MVNSPGSTEDSRELTCFRQCVKLSKLQTQLINKSDELLKSLSEMNGETRRNCCYQANDYHNRMEQKFAIFKAYCYVLVTFQNVKTLLVTKALGKYILFTYSNRSRQKKSRQHTIHRARKNTVNSERSDECIDFTMIITSRNNAPISNYGGGFRCKSEYPWCIIQTDKSSPFRILLIVIKQIVSYKTSSVNPPISWLMFNSSLCFWYILHTNIQFRNVYDNERGATCTTLVAGGSSSYSIEINDKELGIIE
ncbi:hypothetical protein AGLY_014663 [Aphis glycines]|uniref:Uncharacterized protein n=1 Tax=Aphis glycines TaxID=307491 RepID=A0A6G0T1V3_APHGL|nr:hypothetical protein AGLY_014663 [Aphis glycines]